MNHQSPFWRFLASPWIMGPFFGLLYGISARFLIYNEDVSSFWLVTTLGFVFLVPFVMGFLTLYLRTEPFQNRFEQAMFTLFMPWIPTGLSFLAALITGMEATICLIMAAPIFLMMSSFGGIIAELLRNNDDFRIRPSVMAAILVLPISTSTLENHIPLKAELQEVRNKIEIHANPNQVWQQIKTVPLINEEEQQASFFHTLGFPRPLEAKLSFEGVGGVRQASFEDNVLFVETVTEWQPNKSLAFTIEAKAEKSTSPFLSGKILGGHYFDVLDGRYQIEKVEENRVILHLSSQHRVSTHYNFYASFWTRWIMADLQYSILKVIKNRSESRH